MNLKDLKYLVALSEHQHFGKAAEACFVSQPALSMQIKKLESYLGVQLLERTNKSVRLTDIGKTLAYSARSILHQVDELYATAKLASDPFSGELKLGIIPTLAPYLLPYFIRKLSAAYPKLTIYLVEQQTTTLLESLKEGKVDAAILALPINENSFVTTPLFDEEFILAVPKSHKLAKRKTITQDELNPQDLLLLEDGHCLREQALAVCGAIDAKETNQFRATSLETLRHMVASGIGITLMPKLACRSNDGICYVPFSKPKPVRAVGLLHRASTAKLLVLQDMCKRIKEVMSTSILRSTTR